MKSPDHQPLPSLGETRTAYITALVTYRHQIHLRRTTKGKSPLDEAAEAYCSSFNHAVLGQLAVSHTQHELQAGAATLHEIGTRRAALETELQKYPITFYNRPGVMIALHIASAIFTKGIASGIVASTASWTASKTASRLGLSYQHKIPIEESIQDGELVAHSLEKLKLKGGGPEFCNMVLRATVDSERYMALETANALLHSHVYSPFGMARLGWRALKYARKQRKYRKSTATD